MKPLCAILTLAAFSAAAPARAETVLWFYLGKSFTRNSDVRLRQPEGTDLTFRDVSWDDKSFEMPVYYGVRVTHYLDRHPEWGVALDFFHYKVYSNTDAILPVSGTRGGALVDGRERVGDTLQKLDMSHGVNYLTLNAVRRWRHRSDSSEYPNGRLQPYVGLGVGAVIPHVEASVGGRKVGEYQWRGPGYQVFGGLSYGLSRRRFVFGEYKYSRTRITVDVPGGDAKTRLSTHHLVFGGTYRL